MQDIKLENGDSKNGIKNTKKPVILVKKGALDESNKKKLLKYYEVVEVNSGMSDVMPLRW